MKKPDMAGVKEFAEKLMPRLMKYRAVLVVLLAGMLLLATGGRNGEKQQAAAAPEAPQQSFSLDTFEQTLSSQLAAIEGAGRVSLMLSLDETEEAVYAVNVRRSANSGGQNSYESDLTVLSDGSYGEAPVTVKSLLPTFRGAVVLCDGADNDSVRLAVTQAVSTVCGLGADKVTVLKMAAAS